MKHVFFNFAPRFSRRLMVVLLHYHKFESTNYLSNLTKGKGKTTIYHGIKRFSLKVISHYFNLLINSRPKVWVYFPRLQSNIHRGR